MKIIRKKLIFIIFIFVLTLSLSGLCIYNYFHIDIDKVLESEDYSYLPDEAKDYVKKAFEETGEVILTEKNKKKDTAYLNPSYVSYLQLDGKQKDNVSDIPEAYTIDFDFSQLEGIDGLPSKYDLRNHNGYNFVSPIKNQGSTGLCWAFTTGEQVESLLMKNSSTNYTEGFSRLFSVRQLDYATSRDGFINYDNTLNGYRDLTSGGNFFMSSIALGNAISLVDDSRMPFNESVNYKFIEDVFGYDNGGYEVNNAVSIPGFNFDSSYTQEDFDYYINLVKAYVYSFGGAYAGTESPDASCGALNTDGTVILRVDNNCVQNAGHAMHVIGWDDDYTYQYCKSSSSHNNNISSCSPSNIVSGKGAWILKNSWGTGVSKALQYIYLAYDSLDTTFGITTQVSELRNRTWDNNYHNNYNANGVYVSSSDYATHTKIFNGNEKIEKVKFYAYDVGVTYKLSIMNGSTLKSNVKSIYVDLPGLYTFDVSDLDIVIDQSTFKVQVSGGDLIRNTISTFTSNVDNNVEAKMNDVNIEKIYANSNSDTYYEFYLLNKTKNIKSGEKVNYKLFNGSTDISYYMAVYNDPDYNNALAESRVANNEVLTNFLISSLLGAGEYTLKMYYGDTVIATSKVVLNGIISVSGTGRINDPYILTNEDELEMMRDKLNCSGSSCEFYYKLGNDITLTKKWIPIGTSSMPFKGGLDGNGYTISGLDVNGSDRSGLFAYATKATIKNITFNNPKIVGVSHSGVVSGQSLDLIINNVSIVGGFVKSTSGSAGSLIGRYEVTNIIPTIDTVYNSATVSGYISSGLIGTVATSSAYSSLSCYTFITNILNVGDVSFRGFDGDVSRSSLLVGDVSNTRLEISKAIVTGRVLDDELITYNSIVGHYNKEVCITGGTFEDIYYVNGNAASSSTSSIATKKNITDLTKNSSYSGWEHFTEEWKYNTYNGLSRLPSPGNISYPYTDISDFVVGMDKGANLLEYLTPDIDAANNIVVSGVDSNYLTIDAGFNIKGVKTGTTKIRITSNYDGFDKEINVTIVTKANPEIIYHSNDDRNLSDKQVVNLNEQFTLKDNLFVKDGYKLLEWNTKSDGTGDSYTNKQVIDGVTEDLILYAIWDEIRYKIIYNYGGLFDNVEVNLKYSDEVNILNNTHERANYTFNGWNTKSDGSGKSYSGKVSKLTKKDGDVITLYAIWKLNLTFSSDDYNIDNTNNIIDMIEDNTDVTSFKKKFKVSEGFRVDVDTTSDNLIYTGSKTKIYDGNTLVVEFVNVIRGDINGDGKISALDYVKVKNHIMKSNIIDDKTIYFTAADANNDNNISALDYVRIKNIIMKGAN